LPHSGGKHGSKARKEWSAKAAMIPPELSEWIGKCFYPSVPNVTIRKAVERDGSSE